MNRNSPHILLVNPWIHDFAAYDFWAKPLGLLGLASLLRLHGFRVSYIDCLDRFHPRAPQSNPHARYGRGPYLKTRIPKPPGLDDVARNFSRYGIRKAWFHEDLLAAGRPDLILVTSLMTYWYPGVQETIASVKDAWGSAPVILGGIYASLCPGHAETHSGADRIACGPAEDYILDLLGKVTGYRATPKFNPHELDSLPYPAFDLQRKIAYVALMTSRGCPFSCAYCASRILNPRRMHRSPAAVVDEIGYWHQAYGAMDFAFYDDALLVDAKNHALPILEGIIKLNLKLRFHTPNALHIRAIDHRTARLLFRAGFKTLRLGLETAAFDARNALDRKVTAAQFAKAITCLKTAGFESSQVGAYLLVGLPEQSIQSVADSIAVVKQSGITPVLAHYTPIPGTALWHGAVDSSRYDLESDPVFTNNAVFPCRRESFSWAALSQLKELARVAPGASIQPLEG